MSDPDKLRRCTAAPQGSPHLRCEGEMTSNTTHIEDHWATMPDGTRINWTHEVAVRWQPVGAVGDSYAHHASGRAVGDMYLANVTSEIRELGAPASERQVGGEHYRKHKIQPWDIIDEYGLSFYEGSALTYLLRRKGDRLEDLEKCRHYLDKLIEIEEGK